MSISIFNQGTIRNEFYLSFSWIKKAYSTRNPIEEKEKENRG